MQAIRNRYNCLAVAFYNIWSKTVTNCPLTPYTLYAFHSAMTKFPKIAYENPYEPAYTRPEVKYNAPVVISLIAFTLWYSRKAVADEERENRSA